MGNAAVLDCSVLTSDNCFKEFVGTVRSCAPPKNLYGKLSVDRKTCIYPDGHVAELNAPLPTNVDGKSGLDVTMRLNGKVCFHWEQDLHRLSDESGSAVELVTSEPSTVTLTCADGRRYASDDYLGLFNCVKNVDEREQHVIGLTQYNNSGGGRSSVALLGVGVEALQVVACEP